MCLCLLTCEVCVKHRFNLLWEVGGLTHVQYEVEWLAFSSVGLIFLLLLSLYLSITPSLRLFPGQCDVFWSSEMRLFPVLSFLRCSSSQTDCNYFLSGTGSVWRTKCTQNTLVMIGLVCTKCKLRTQTDKHTHDHKRQACFHRHLHTHTKSIIADEHRHRKGPTFSPSCLVYTGYMQSHVVLLLLTRVVQDMHIQNHTYTYCMHAQQPAI